MPSVRTFGATLVFTVWTEVSDRNQREYEASSLFISISSKLLALSVTLDQCNFCPIYQLNRILEEHVAVQCNFSTGFFLKKKDKRWQAWAFILLCECLETYAKPIGQTQKHPSLIITRSPNFPETAHVFPNQRACLVSTVDFTRTFFEKKISYATKWNLFAKFFSEMSVTFRDESSDGN